MGTRKAQKFPFRLPRGEVLLTLGTDHGGSFHDRPYIFTLVHDTVWTHWSGNVRRRRSVGPGDSDTSGVLTDTRVWFP